MSFTQREMFLKMPSPKAPKNRRTPPRCWAMTTTSQLLLWLPAKWN